MGVPGTFWSLGSLSRELIDFFRSLGVLPLRTGWPGSRAQSRVSMRMSLFDSRSASRESSNSQVTTYKTYR